MTMQPYISQCGTTMEMCILAALLFRIFESHYFHNLLFSVQQQFKNKTKSISRNSNVISIWTSCTSYHIFKNYIYAKKAKWLETRYGDFLLKILIEKNKFWLETSCSLSMLEPQTSQQVNNLKDHKSIFIIKQQRQSLQVIGI